MALPMNQKIYCTHYYRHILIESHEQENKLSYCVCVCVCVCACACVCAHLNPTTVTDAVGESELVKVS